MNRQALDIPAAMLMHAPWNPRARITRDSVADLTASIRTDGLIQRLVVIFRAEENRYVVIAGNRRLVACREAGLDPVPCEVLDVDEPTAKRMTLIENLQRCDVDPLMEADLIHGLTDDGMTIEAIAAETGRGEKWVWRRQQLTKLEEGWRKLASDGEHEVTVDCLEHVARYPADVQRRVLESVDASVRALRWDSLSYSFQREVRKLDQVKFRRDDCANCSCNSANAPMLFDFGDGRKTPKFGECLCVKCFRKKTDQYFDGLRAKAEKQGYAVVRVEHVWDIPDSWDAADKADQKHNVLYLVQDRDGSVSDAKWSCKKSAPKVDKKAQAAEAAKRKAAKRMGGIADKLLGLIRHSKWLDEQVGDKVFRRDYDAVRKSCAALALAVAFGCDGYDQMDDDHTVSEVAAGLVDGFASLDYEIFTSHFHDRVVDRLTGCSPETVIGRLIGIFPRIAQALGEDDVEFVKNYKKGN